MNRAALTLLFTGFATLAAVVGPSDAHAFVLDATKPNVHLAINVPGAVPCVVLPAWQREELACEGLDPARIAREYTSGGAASDGEVLGLAVVRQNGFAFTTVLTRHEDLSAAQFEPGEADARAQEFVRSYRALLSSRDPSLVVVGNDADVKGAIRVQRGVQIVKTRVDLQTPASAADEPSASTPRAHLVYLAMGDGVRYTLSFLGDPSRMAAIEPIAEKAVATFELAPAPSRARRAGGYALRGLVIVAGVLVGLGVLFMLGGKQKTRSRSSRPSELGRASSNPYAPWQRESGPVAPVAPVARNRDSR